MHFALPRKSSSPPPYARASARAAANQRRQQIQYLSYVVLLILTIYLIYGWVFVGGVSGDDGSISEDSSIVILTVFDEGSMSEDHITMVKTNRDDYAARHGYKTYYTNTSTYKNLFDTSPSSWALLPALRQTLTLYPETDYVWALSANALITNFTINLYEHILKPLPNLMLKDIPVVPPDSVIHTFSHLKPSSANLILTQDYDNLAHTSFILRNTLRIPQPTNKPKDAWTQYFLDAWFDPLYREYAFQKAENHALEHIVQWHPTLLAKIVLVQQRRLNSYNFHYPLPKQSETRAPVDSMWREGDLIVNFKGCEDTDQRDCEKELRDYFRSWVKDVERIDGKLMDVQLKVPMYEYKPKSKPKDKPPTEYELKRTHI